MQTVALWILEKNDARKAGMASQARVIRKKQNKIMEISIYSTIDFSKARNLLTERQRDVKAFNPILNLPTIFGFRDLILENNPTIYLDFVGFYQPKNWVKITSTICRVATHALRCYS